jgi:hypothetical protein
MKLLVVIIFHLVGLLPISSALALEGMTLQQIEQKEAQEKLQSCWTGQVHSSVKWIDNGKLTVPRL